VVGISNHCDSRALRRLSSGGLLSRSLLVVLFLASLGFRSVEPCSAAHHDACLETASAQEKMDHEAPCGGHRNSKQNSTDCCCPSAIACEPHRGATLANTASTVQETFRICMVVSGLVRPALVPDYSSIVHGRDHAPPATPLFITLKALLI
jgi:hypothetical protein